MYDRGESQKERAWHPAALELLDRLVLSNMYVGAIRGRMRAVLGWYPSEHEVLWQAGRWNRKPPPSSPSRPAKPMPAPDRPKLGPGGFTMLGGRAR
jgi:hypothetical protein